MKVLVTRPARQAAATAVRLRALGHEAIVSPLLEIIAIDWEMPPDLPDVVIISSANALIGGLPPKLRDCPFFTMGAASATAATAAGARQVTQVQAKGVGDLYAAARAQGARTALHLCGRHRTHAAAPEGLTVISVETYEAERRSLLPAALGALAGGEIDLALIYSGRTMAQFADDLAAAKIARADVSVALLGEAAKDDLSGWQTLMRAPRPDEDSLFRAAGLL
ncbi:MAG: uroporphyrinogen-III synthase [Pacificimonas sp.]